MWAHRRVFVAFPSAFWSIFEMIKLVITVGLLLGSVMGENASSLVGGLMMECLQANTRLP